MTNRPNRYPKSLAHRCRPNLKKFATKKANEKANEEPGPQEAARPENGARKPAARQSVLPANNNSGKWPGPSSFAAKCASANAVQDEIPSARPRERAARPQAQPARENAAVPRNAEGAPKWRVITPVTQKISGPDLWPHSKISAGGPVSLPWLFACRPWRRGWTYSLSVYPFFFAGTRLQGYALASAAFILLQEGMGARPFGAAVVWYRGGGGFHAWALVSRWVISSSFFLLSACLGCAY